MRDLAFEQLHQQWVAEQMARMNTEPKKAILWYIEGQVINLMDYETIINTALHQHFDNERWCLSKKIESFAHYTMDNTKQFAPPPIPDDALEVEGTRTVEQRQKDERDANLRSIFG
jgi:hypothetical protein